MIERDRQTDKERERQRDRQTDRQTERERENTGGEGIFSIIILCKAHA